MPVKKGGKKKKRGANISIDKRELVFAQDGQFYAEVTKKVGNGRVNVMCFGINEERLATICGNMRKRVWVDVGDTVLVNEREYQPDRVDLVYKYTPDEARNLRAYKEITNEPKRDEFEFAEENDDNEFPIEHESEEEIIFTEE